MIGLVVDSNSQMPADLAERLGIVVVPLTVTIDGADRLEGVDLEADEFYGYWSDGHTPQVSTSQPSPGRFAEAYRRVIEAGATEILSVHIAASMSGTLNAARLAAQTVAVPVRLVDTQTASFGISCCAWAAADAIEAGADLETAALTAERRGADLHTSFVVGVPGLVDRSGRAVGLGVEAVAETGVPIIAMTGQDLTILASVENLDAAVEAMAADALAWPPSVDDGLRIAIGTSDVTSEPLAASLTRMLSDDERVVDVVQYRIGPSVGAHTGPGTAGLFVF